MAEPFRFQNCLYMVESTGKSARNLRGLLDAMRTVDDLSIFCHLYLPLMGHHIIPPEYLNDFTYWIGEVVGDDLLVEKVMNVHLQSPKDIGAFRDNMIRVLEEHVGGRKTPKVAAENAFYFNRCVLVIYPTGQTASSVREFVDVFEDIGLNSMFYHMFVSPMVFDAPVNDFSRWVGDVMGYPEVAEGLERLDPYGYDSLEQLKEDIFELIGGEVW